MWLCECPFSTLQLRSLRGALVVERANEEPESPRSRPGSVRGGLVQELVCRRGSLRDDVPFEGGAGAGALSPLAVSAVVARAFIVRRKTRRQNLRQRTNACRRDGPEA